MSFLGIPFVLALTKVMELSFILFKSSSLRKRVGKESLELELETRETRARLGGLVDSENVGSGGASSQGGDIFKFPKSRKGRGV